MKTSIKTLFASALTALFLTSSAFTTFANDDVKNQKVSSTAMNVQMIIVKGDVNVYLIKADHENIKIVSAETENPKVSIKKLGGKLLISGSSTERVTMYVYMKDIKRIEAWDTANIKTQGEFNTDALQILLHDQAKANVDVNAKSLYTVIKDEASLKLSGTSESHDLSKAEYASLKMHNFNAAKTNGLTIAPTYAAAQVNR